MILYEIIVIAAQQVVYIYIYVHQPVNVFHGDTKDPSIRPHRGLFQRLFLDSFSFNRIYFDCL